MSLLKSLPAVFLSIAVLTGCSSISVVSPEVYDEIGKIGISIDKGRSEQLYRQELQRLISRNGLRDQRYDLISTISSKVTDNNITMSVDFKLYDQEIGEVITSHSFSSLASIGAISSSFGSSQAENHARERLSLNLAQKTFSYLALFFSRNESDL